MARREIIAITIIIIFGFGIIISIPIFLITVGFTPHYSIGDQLSREEVFNSSAIIDFNLNIEFGDIEITYTNLPSDCHAKVDLNIDLIGQNILEKNYTDFFNIEWINTNNSFTFTMVLLAESKFNQVSWIEKEVSVIVTLNPNILFNINITIQNEGNVDLLVPWGVNINNIDAYIGKGDIAFDFNYCIIGGNITGIVGVGDIELNVINVKYTRNCIWNLTTNFEGTTITTGDIIIVIIQETAINVNVTGIVKTNRGEITLYYTDINPNVGANFTFYRRDIQGSIQGFESGNDIDTSKWWLVRFYYYSYDYPTIGNYDISSYIYNEGPYLINLKNT